MSVRKDVFASSGLIDLSTCSTICWNAEHNNPSTDLGLSCNVRFLGSDGSATSSAVTQVPFQLHNNNRKPPRT